ncbi:MAG: hypothetical protein ABL927_10960 [Bdellovibrionales bacterium]
MKSYFSLLIFLISTLILPRLLWAQDYKVNSVNEQFTRVIIDVPHSDLKDGDYLQFKDSYEDLCTGKIINNKTQTAVVDISKCNNKKEIKIGVLFSKFSGTPNTELPPQNQSNPPKKSSGVTADEDWYTLWGLGISGISYSDKSLQAAVDIMDRTPGIDHSASNFDLFGFYWPMADRKSMQGFIINVLSDSFTAGNESLTIDQNLYAYSYHKFYGANIGDGWFLRGDIGLVKDIVEVKGTLAFTSTSKTGFGVLAGGGYGWGIGTDTRMLLGLYVSSRKASNIASSASNIGFSFLF